MVAGGTNSSGTGDKGVDELRARCERCLGQLGELTRIHLTIDAPKRRIGTNEPDWICRLRKVCLHVTAINGLEIGADVEHVMATELRAAYWQMDAVWKCVPEKFRLEKMGRGPWADEARNGLLATYDHPTPQSLMFPAAAGGRRLWQRRGLEELCTARRMAVRTRTRIRACAWLSSGGFGR